MIKVARTITILILLLSGRILKREESKLKLFCVESSDYCQTDLRYAYEDGVSNVPTLLKLYSDLTLLSDESFNSDFSLFERQVFTVIVT